ncbi:hypothetical protein IR196_13695 [Brucella anthropi]|uniref:hypothetical protein n=1 Tax=Brucella anthropi TaxID=529 RepID=UPI00188B444E|nr:hypothetical protein [Brucella anthropi]QPA29256.1 hypothetical protein IR196_13695 [Brucella anthropi]
MRANAILKARQEVERAECAAESALGAVRIAKDGYRMRQLARRRVSDIMTVLNFDTEGRDVSRELARPFAEALASGLLWEQGGDTGLTAQFISNALPCLSTVEVEEIVARSYAMSNQDVARLLNVNLEKRQTLGLTMIGACDLSDDELVTFRKSDALQRAAERKRRSRPRGLEQRRYDEQAKRIAIEEFADANGVAPKTVKNWITSGKAVVETVRENGVLTIRVYRGDAIIPASATRKTPAIGQKKSSIVDFPTQRKAGGALQAHPAEGADMHIDKTMEVGRAAMMFSLSALRSMPAGFAENLAQKATSTAASPRDLGIAVVGALGDQRQHTE